MKPFINKHFKYIAYPTNFFEKDKYYIIAGDSFFMTKKQMEACISVIRYYLKRFKKKRNVLNFIQFNVALTQKPKGARMGSGKGKIKEYVAKIDSNSILFIFQKVKRWRALKIYTYMKTKLPIRLHIKHIRSKKKKNIASSMINTVNMEAVSIDSYENDEDAF